MTKINFREPGEFGEGATMTTNSVSKEQIEAMIAGLEGVTPGPWDTRANLVRAIDGDDAIPVFESRMPWKKHRHTRTVVNQEWHNLNYIARCDPDTMRSILTELQALRASSGGVTSGEVVKALTWARVGWVEAFAAPEGLGVWYAISALDPKAGTAPFTLKVFVGTRRKTSTSEMWTDGGTFSTIEAAKAAAQSDFDRRIRSALSSLHAQPEGERGKIGRAEEWQNGWEKGYQAAREEATIAPSHPQGTGIREAVAWRFTHSGIDGQPRSWDFTGDKSIVDTKWERGLIVEPLVPLSLLQAVERERDILKYAIEQANGQLSIAALTALTKEKQDG